MRYMNPLSSFIRLILIYTDRVCVGVAPNTHFLMFYRTSHIFKLEQQQLYAMRCTTVASVEAGSHVGCQRQFPETVVAADRDCGADGERSELEHTTPHYQVSTVVCPCSHKSHA